MVKKTQNSREKPNKLEAISIRYLDNKQSMLKLFKHKTQGRTQGFERPSLLVFQSNKIKQSLK